MSEPLNSSSDQDAAKRFRRLLSEGDEETSEGFTSEGLTTGKLSHHPTGEPERTADGLRRSGCLEKASLLQPRISLEKGKAKASKKKSRNFASHPQRNSAALHLILSRQLAPMAYPCRGGLRKPMRMPLV